jgi:hypothetical protein
MTVGCCFCNRFKEALFEGMDLNKMKIPGKTRAQIVEFFYRIRHRDLDICDWAREVSLLAQHYIHAHNTKLKPNTATLLILLIACSYRYSKSVIITARITLWPHSSDTTAHACTIFFSAIAYICCQTCDLAY